MRLAQKVCHRGQCVYVLRARSDLWCEWLVERVALRRELPHVVHGDEREKQEEEDKPDCVRESFRSPAELAKPDRVEEKKEDPTAVERGDGKRIDDGKVHGQDAREL